MPIIHHVPGHDLNGSYENQLDALYQTFQDPILLTTTILLILSIAFFNFFGLAVTGCLSVSVKSSTSIFTGIGVSLVVDIFITYGQSTKQ
ncbi:unnamed protein product [Dibothriocephalus latus]|uniref:Uncharacterized protein n=1 Tax=Dibothriocephalus latus TaxID=60516 RepID=A0A3P7N6K7_DIBLA|nr:unnamed protein product [Dibothriocephalus latus]